jgi:ligand-binding sensor domain-containing protein
MNKLFYSKNLLVCGIFFFHLIAATAQSSGLSLKLATKHISRADGLTESHINSTFIDSKSKIWFLTNNKIGLFKAGLVNNHQFTDSFSNKGFNSAIEDNRGNFWLTENLEWFYPFNVHRCVVFNPETKKTLSFEKYIGKKLNIHSIVSDPEGVVFLGTKNGEIYKFDSQKKRLERVINLAQSPVKVLHAGIRKIVVCIERTPKFDAKILEIEKTGKILSRQNLGDKLVKTALEHKGKTYFTFENGKHIGIRELTGKFERRFVVSKDSYLSSITFNKSKGLFIINKGNELAFLNEKFELIKNEKYDCLIHHVIHDSSGNTFLATNNGVFILRLVEQRIKTYLTNPLPDKSNDNFSCRAILKLSNDQVIVNTNRKRQLIDLRQGKVRSLEQSFNQNSPDNKFILSILQDKDGQVLFGEDMLMQTDLRTSKNKLLRKLDSTKIWSMASYRNGILLGLEKKGIVFYDKINDISSNYKIADANLRNSIIYDFYVINYEKVLVASEAGLFILKNNRDFEAVKLPIKTLSLSFFSIKKNKIAANKLLLASSQGIWIYDILSNVVSPFVQDYNFQQKKFLSAYQTQNGVWASSEEGVWHFNDSGILLKIFTTNDGLSSNECNRLAHHQDENDLLYFGGINGLNIINPRDFSNQVEPQFPLKINNITTYASQIINRADIGLVGSKLELKRHENSLSIDLDYEDFKYDCTKKYFYRSSKSIRKDWMPITGSTLLLDYVARGQTEVEIKVVSCDNFIESPIIKFTVERPKQIYLEWHFVPSVLLLLGFLFWVFNKYTTYKLRLRNESLQRKVDRQTRSLQDSLTLKETLLSLLVHDVRYPVQSFYDLSKKLVYLTKKNDQERLVLLGKETEDKSRKVLWLIDELVYWVKSTKDKNEITLQNKNIGEQIQQILDIYADEIEQRNLNIIMSNTAHSITADYGLLIIVLRNLIYNAVVHSKASSGIHISLKKGDEKFILKIENQSDAKTRKLDGGLGIGLALLLPLLEKSNIKLKTELIKTTFIAELELITKPLEYDQI